MTGQDFQDKLDAIVEDLHTGGKGQRIQLMFRSSGNRQNILELSSDAAGVVDARELTAIQTFLDTIKPFADEYTVQFAPVQAASEIFRLAREVHQTLIDAATAARVALNDALEADQNYQAAKTAYDAARENADYVAAREAYRINNVSENFGNLSDAKGKYLV